MDGSFAPPVPRAGDPSCAQKTALTLIDAPFAAGAQRIEAPAGLSILDMLERAEVRPRVAQRCVVMIGDRPVPRALWERVRPKAGVTVLVAVRPGASGGKGGSNPLRVILQIAVMVASAFLVAAGMPFAAAAVSTLGNLAVSALVPPPKAPVNESTPSKPTYALEGAQNEARLFGAVPTVLGRRRVALCHAARPYTEIAGDDLGYRMLLTPGIGPCGIEDTRIGATGVASYPQVEIEPVSGGPGAPPVTIFPAGVLESNPAVELTYAGGYVMRETGADCDEISVDITFPRGLALFDDNGARLGQTVALEVAYKPVDAEGGLFSFALPNASLANSALLASEGSLALRDPGQPGFGSSWAGWEDFKAQVEADAVMNVNCANGVFVIHASDDQPVRQNVRWAVPRGKYIVALRRASPEAGNDRVVDQAQWSALRTIRTGTPRVPPGTPLLPLRAAATEQLQGQLEVVTAIVTSIRYRWNGTAFADYGMTRNCGDLFYSVLKGYGNPRPFTDARIDVATLGAWAELCTLRNWTCDVVIEDGRSVLDVLATIAACGRARVVRRGGKISVVVDVPRATSGQMFTPRNSRNFKARKTFLPAIHAVRAQFANEEKDWLQDEAIIYAPGYTEANATLYEQLAFEALTHPARVSEATAYHLAVARQRSEIFTLDADVEHAIAGHGDVAYLATDVILEGLGQARVKALLDGAGLPLGEEAEAIGGVRLDEFMLMGPGQEYGLRVRRPDSTDVWPVAGGVGETDVLLFETPVAIEAGPRPGDLVAFGLRGEETFEVVVREKGRPDKAGITALTFEAYAHPAIDEAATLGGAAGFTSTITRPWMAAPPNVVVNNAYWTDAAVVVDFAIPAGEHTVIGFEASWRMTPAASETIAFVGLPGLKPSDRRLSFVPDKIGPQVDVELVAVDAYGRRSPSPVRVTVDAALSPQRPLLAPVDFQGDQLGDTVRFRWSASSDPTIRYEIRAGVSWETGRRVLQAVGASASEVWPIREDEDAIFWIKPFDRFGNFSETATLWIARIMAPVDRNVVITEDFPDLAWPGVRHDCHLDGEYLAMDMVGGASVLRADYYHTIDLAIETTARCWINHRINALIGDDGTWEDDELTWAQSGDSTWEPEVSDASATLTGYIAVNQAPALSLLEGFRFNNTLTGVNATAPLAAVATSYGPCKFADGVSVGPLGALHYAIDIGIAFSALMDLRVTSVPAFEAAILTLSNDAGDFMQIWFDPADGVIRLSSNVGPDLVCAGPVEAGDTLSISLWQSTSARGLVVASRRHPAVRTAVLETAAGFIFNRVSILGSSAHSPAWEDMGDLAWDEMGDQTWANATLTGPWRKPLPGFLGDAAFHDNVIEGVAFADVWAMRGPIGYGPFQEFYAGERTLESAIIWESMRAPAPDGQTPEITRAIVTIDVPDRRENGSGVLVPVEGQHVSFSRPFYITPSVIGDQVGDQPDGAVLAKSVITNITNEGFDWNFVEVATGAPTAAAGDFHAAGF